MNKSMKLSTAQQRAMIKLSAEEWKTPYELSESISTLRSLVAKGLVECRGYGDLGFSFSPTTTLKYILKK